MSGVELPVARTLAHVLRGALSGGDGVRLVRATCGAPTVGTELYSHVNVIVGGVTVKVPRLAGGVTPRAGGPAYLLASRDFLLYIGTVQTTA